MHKPLATFFAAAVAFFFAATSAAHAAPVLISQGESRTFNYDFTASPAPGPFTFLSFGLGFAKSEPLDPGDKLTIEFFDSLDVLLLSYDLETLSGVPVGGSGVFVAFGPTSDKVGRVTVTADVGNVLLTEFNVSYFEGDGQGSNFTENIELIRTSTALSEPSALALLGLGLVGLARLRRKAKGTQVR